MSDENVDDCSPAVPSSPSSPQGEEVGESSSAGGHPIERDDESKERGREESAATTNQGESAASAGSNNEDHHSRRLDALETHLREVARGVGGRDAAEGDDAAISMISMRLADDLSRRLRGRVFGIADVEDDSRTPFREALARWEDRLCSEVETSAKTLSRCESMEMDLRDSAGRVKRRLVRRKRALEVGAVRPRVVKEARREGGPDLSELGRIEFRLRLAWMEVERARRIAGRNAWAAAAAAQAGRHAGSNGGEGSLSLSELDDPDLDFGRLLLSSPADGGASKLRDTIGERNVRNLLASGIPSGRTLLTLWERRDMSTIGRELTGRMYLAVDHGVDDDEGGKAAIVEKWVEAIREEFRRRGVDTVAMTLPLPLDEVRRAADGAERAVRDGLEATERAWASFRADRKETDLKKREEVLWRREEELERAEKRARVCDECRRGSGSKRKREVDGDEREQRKRRCAVDESDGRDDGSGAGSAGEEEGDEDSDGEDLDLSFARILAGKAARGGHKKKNVLPLHALRKLVNAGVTTGRELAELWDCRTRSPQAWRRVAEICATLKKEKGPGPESSENVLMLTVEKWVGVVKGELDRRDAEEKEKENEKAGLVDVKTHLPAGKNACLVEAGRSKLMAGSRPYGRPRGSGGGSSSKRAGKKKQPPKPFAPPRPPHLVAWELRRAREVATQQWNHWAAAQAQRAVAFARAQQAYAAVPQHWSTAYVATAVAKEGEVTPSKKPSAAARKRVPAVAPKHVPAVFTPAQLLQQAQVRAATAARMLPTHAQAWAPEASEGKPTKEGEPSKKSPGSSAPPSAAASQIGAKETMGAGGDKSSKKSPASSAPPSTAASKIWAKETLGAGGDMSSSLKEEKSASAPARPFAAVAGGSVETDSTQIPGYPRAAPFSPLGAALAGAEAEAKAESGGAIAATSNASRPDDSAAKIASSGGDVAAADSDATAEDQTPADTDTDADTAASDAVLV